MNFATRLDGGVVTQRIANPCTPVRFRLGPPFSAGVHIAFVCAPRSIIPLAPSRARFVLYIGHIIIAIAVDIFVIWVDTDKAWLLVRHDGDLLLTGPYPLTRH